MPGPKMEVQIQRYLYISLILSDSHVVNCVRQGAFLANLIKVELTQICMVETSRDPVQLRGQSQDPCVSE